MAGKANKPVLNIEGFIRSFITYAAQGAGDALPDKTPARVIKAYEAMLSGYEEDPETILAARFRAEDDQMVMLRGVPFSSLCEHHLLPFIGTAHVGYIPAGGSVVGVSKLARLVNCYAKRLQIQERLTHQIAGALQTHLKPSGVGVVLSAVHTCMCARGVRSKGEFITSAMFGALRDSTPARAEFFQLAGVV